MTYNIFITLINLFTRKGIVKSSRVIWSAYKHKYMFDMLDIIIFIIGVILICYIFLTLFHTFLIK
jgi:hypothetical protein